MWTLRVKIDSWSKGLDENLRNRNRKLLIDSYLRLPPRRVYLYLKRYRFAVFETEPDGGKLGTLYELTGAGRSLQAAEDTIARGKYILY